MSELSEKQLRQFLWVEKFRPTKLSDLILPDEVKPIFEGYIKDKQIPNLLLHSRTPGSGKTSSAVVLCNETEANYILVNASLEANLDLLRSKLDHFAATVSMDGSKIIILDEVDGAAKKNAQFFDSLRGFIEKYSHNCTFIMTCNFVDKVPDYIRSRTQQFDFSITDKISHAKKMFNRSQFILDSEGVKYDKMVVAEIIKKFNPDFRTVIQNLQKHKDSLSDSKLKYRLGGFNIEPLMNAMKTKDLPAIIKYVTEELTVTDGIYRMIFNELKTYVKDESIGSAILLMADYMGRSANVADSEIFCISFLIDFANNVKFKA